MPPKDKKAAGGGDKKAAGGDKKAGDKKAAGGKGGDKKAGDDKKAGKDDKKAAGGKDDKKAAGGDDKKAAAAGGDDKKDEKEKVAAKPKKVREEKPKSSRRQRKEKYRAKLKDVLSSYRNALIVGVDNVGSNQLQKIRLATRKDSTVLMGKNTIIRKVIRELAPTNPKLEALLPYVVGNMGFVFSNGDLSKVRDVVSANKVPAVAKSGAFAPDDVFVPPGPTGLDPAQTSFFQALNIGTKIAKGSIEIVNTVHLIRKGEKITASAVALLTKLDIKPFFYGVKVQHVYEDGVVYSASVLDLTEEDLLQKFYNGVRTLAALSIGASYPTMATVPSYLQEGFRKLLAVSFETEYTFNEAKLFKDAAASAPKVVEKKEEKKVEEKKEEEEKEEESDGEMGLGGGLFGSDD